MTEADRRALHRLTGGDASVRATTDDLQGLLLQVVFALLMVFMVAYFVFVADQRRERVEEVMAVNRQKLTLALDRVAEDRRIRYGLNALLTQGTDGRRAFEPDAHVRDGKIVLTPAAQAAFSSGARAAGRDYAEPSSLAAAWRREVLAAAQLSEADLKDEERSWLEQALAERIEAVRLDVRGVQRSLAARLQRQWVDDPSRLKGVTDPRAIAAFLRTESLKLVEAAIRNGTAEEARVLP
ncbi:MAG: hypothetical protein ACI4RD_08990 [Kiritimatiellia bacterium]